MVDFGNAFGFSVAGSNGTVFVGALIKDDNKRRHSGPVDV